MAGADAEHGKSWFTGDHNLNDPDAVAVVVAHTPPSPDPGHMHESTLSLNWYWSANARSQFDWMHCFLDNAVNGDSDCDIFAARFQIGVLKQ